MIFFFENKLKSQIKQIETNLLGATKKWGKKRLSMCVREREIN